MHVRVWCLDADLPATIMCSFIRFSVSATGENRVVLPGIRSLGFNSYRPEPHCA